MDRRRFLLTSLAGALAGPLAAEAQPKSKVYRVGFLAGISFTAAGPPEAFRQGLHELGWVEGQNIVIDFRSADCRFDRLLDMAAELVRLKVDVIVASATPAAVENATGTPSALAARQATRTILIVFPAASDPVASGLVSTLARPGGNVTGLSFFSPELVGKCLELLKQIVPEVRGIAVLWQPEERPLNDMLKGAEVAARPRESGFNSLRRVGQTISTGPSQR